MVLWSSLAIQFWPLYNIVNEKGATIAEAWDGENLRQTVSNQVMQPWFKLCNIADSISFNDDCDAIIWNFNSSGTCSV